MANREIYFMERGEGDYDALKFELGAMRGVISMDMDGDGSVHVSYDDSFVNERQISSCAGPLGYVNSNGRNATPNPGQSLF